MGAAGQRHAESTAKYGLPAGLTLFGCPGIVVNVGMNAPYLLGDTVTGLPRRTTSFGGAIPRLGDQHRACGREILRLNAEIAALRDELERERLLNEDLGRSAAMWIRLYEEQLTRANALAQAPGAPEGLQP